MEIDSELQLVDFMNSIAVDVNPRDEGRTTSQVENWSTTKLLVALAKTHHIKYPVKLLVNDKPDFDLIFSKSKVGVEITEAIPEDYARAIAMANRLYPEAIIDRSHFLWGAPRKSNDEIHEILESSINRLSGPGWEGDSVEREWANGISDTIHSKLKKLNNNGYRLFPKYWLAIYDNLRGPALNLKLGVKFLREILPNQDSYKHSFQYVFIEVGNTMVSISKGGQLRYYPIA